jgi:ribosomal protein L35AE/L33A
MANGLFTIFGKHTYPHPGTYRGLVIASAGNSGPVRAHFTVNWP